MRSIKFFICLLLPLFIIVCIRSNDVIAEQLRSTKSSGLINTFSFYKEIPEKLQMGCGCSFFKNTSQEEMIFISDMSTEALMKIEGKIVYIHSENPAGTTYSKIGGKRNYKYNADGITVYIELRATSVCESNDEKCEAQNYGAIFTVIKGRKKQTIKANGVCGC